MACSSSIVTSPVMTLQESRNPVIYVDNRALAEEASALFSLPLRCINTFMRITTSLRHGHTYSEKECCQQIDIYWTNIVLKSLQPTKFTSFEEVLAAE